MDGLNNFTSAQAAVVGGIVGTVLTVMSIIFVVYYVLLVISRWKLFKKAGEKGWKAIIPLYNLYVLYKLTWSKKYFWILMVSTILWSICRAVYQTATGNTQLICSFILLILIIVLIVLYFISLYRLAKAYGHGAGYTIGLIFLNFIFILILAFGKSEYQGNVYLKAKENK